MNKEKWFLKLFKLLINILYIGFLLVISNSLLNKVGFDDWLDLDFNMFLFKFLLCVVIWMIVYFIAYVLSISVHELGHLIFGLKAKLEFVSFNILNYTIIKENNKKEIKKMPRINGIGGCCYMAFDEKYNYNSYDVILYFFGGIICNSIMVVLITFIYLLSKNDYLSLICLLFISINVYLALYNMIPQIQKNGIRSDMMHIILYLKEPNIIKIYGKISKIQEYVNEGGKLKDLDSSLVYMPREINNIVKLQMAQIYIDYLLDKERYDEAIKKIKFIKENAKSIMTFSNENMLKAQLILSLYNKGYINEIENEWDKDFSIFVKKSKSIMPYYIAIEYMYYRLIKNDIKKCEKCLYEVEKLKKYGNNSLYKSIKELIEKIDDKYL